MELASGLARTNPSAVSEGRWRVDTVKPGSGCCSVPARGPRTELDTAARPPRQLPWVSEQPSAWAPNVASAAHSEEDRGHAQTGRGVARGPMGHGHPDGDAVGQRRLARTCRLYRPPHPHGLLPLVPRGAPAFPRGHGPAGSHRHLTSRLSPRASEPSAETQFPLAVANRRAQTPPRGTVCPRNSWEPRGSSVGYRSGAVDADGALRTVPDPVAGAGGGTGSPRWGTNGTLVRTLNTMWGKGNDRSRPPNQGAPRTGSAPGEGSEDAGAGLTAPAFRAGAVDPLLSTFTSSLDSSKCPVPQRIPVRWHVLLGAGDRVRRRLKAASPPDPGQCFPFQCRRSPGINRGTFCIGAGDRDRTGMASLEGWGSTIELHPRDADQEYRPGAQQGP